MMTTILEFNFCVIHVCHLNFCYKTPYHIDPCSICHELYDTMIQTPMQCKITKAWLYISYMILFKTAGLVPNGFFIQFNMERFHNCFKSTYTLNFQGQIFSLLYIMTKSSDCHKTKKWTLDPKCSHNFLPWLWPLPWILQIKLVNTSISGLARLIGVK